MSAPKRSLLIKIYLSFLHTPTGLIRNFRHYSTFHGLFYILLKLLGYEEGTKISKKGVLPSMSL